MTDLEFDVLDELYFVQSFDDLKQKLIIKEDTLRATLHVLVKKGWVKCLDKQEREILDEGRGFSDNYLSYRFLATKAGLMAHNTR
ncbi:MAG: transporter [Cyclobacteriaceae bacterium]|nr:transporter [Cyclobacteriaceae bacterium]MCH8514837.1 transporter [Cyclobacteriaceae bacterium]